MHIDDYDNVILQLDGFQAIVANVEDDEIVPLAPVEYLYFVAGIEVDASPAMAAGTARAAQAADYDDLLSDDAGPYALWSY